MKRYLGRLIVFLICSLIIVGGILGWDRTDVQVTGNAFTPNQVQITAYDSVYFQNQTGHGVKADALASRFQTGFPNKTHSQNTHKKTPMSKRRPKRAG